MTDERLLAALTDVADHVAYPPTRDLAPGVVHALAQPAPRPSHNRRRAVLIVVGAVAGLLLLPGPREALADFFGISTVRIVRVDTIPAETGSRLRLGREVGLDDLPGGVAVLTPSTIDAPARAYVDEPAPGAVNLVWAPTADLPAIGDSGVGLLLTEIPGAIDLALLEKRLDPTTTVEQVQVGTTTGYWIAGGPHQLLYLAPDGTVREETSRLAANTLLWTEGGVVFRLETSLDKAAALTLATSLEPLR